MMFIFIHIEEVHINENHCRVEFRVLESMQQGLAIISPDNTMVLCAGHSLGKNSTTDIIQIEAFT